MGLSGKTVGRPPSSPPPDPPASQPVPMAAPNWPGSAAGALGAAGALHWDVLGSRMATREGEAQPPPARVFLASGAGPYIICGGRLSAS